MPDGGSTLSIAGGDNATVTVSEAGYSGTFAATTSDKRVATVATIAEALARKTSAIAAVGKTFKITGHHSGTATISFSDSNGHTSAATVNVSGATPTPSPSPTAKPTASPTAKPTASPTTKPTSSPTAKPTASPTARPTASPTARPTASPTARPTASPTPVPTPTPAGPVPSLTTIAFTATGQTQSVTVTESHYSGTWTAVSADTGVAKVTPGSGTSFTVKAIGAGSTTITIKDSLGNPAHITVGVTTTGGGINLKRKPPAR